MTIALEPLPLYAAPPAAAPAPEPQKERAETVIPARGVGQTEEIDSFTPEVYPERRHPGYIIGNHWLETAYSRVCMGESEGDVLRDRGWQRVDDINALMRSVEALRRDAERYRWLQDAGQKRWMELTDMTAEATEAAIDAAMQEGKT